MVNGNPAGGCEFCAGIREFSTILREHAVIETVRFGMLDGAFHCLIMRMRPSLANHLKAPHPSLPHVYRDKAAFRIPPYPKSGDFQ